MRSESRTLVRCVRRGDRCSIRINDHYRIRFVRMEKEAMWIDVCDYH